MVSLRIVSRLRLICALFFVSALTGAAFAGNGIIHEPVKQAPQGAPILIETGFVGQVEYASLYYRKPADPAFTAVPMTRRMNGNFGAEIQSTGLAKGQVVEYYVLMELPNGQTVSMPERNPESMPLQIVISTKKVVQESGIEVVVLSPEAETSINQSDFMVAISMFSDTPVNVKNLRLVMDGSEDVTKKADITPELVTYIDKKLVDGPHAVRLWYTMENGDKVILAEAIFDIVKEGGEDILSGKGFTRASGGQLGGGESSAFSDGAFTANFRSEYKNQNNLGDQTIYKRAGAEVAYEKKWFQVSAAYDYDSEDDPRKNQPLTRYLLHANVDNIVIFNYGDSYPQFSPVTLYGTRVRGISGGVYLGVFNFEYVQGEINRKVISKADEDKKNSLLDAVAGVPLADRDSAIADYLAADPDNRVFTGTFERRVTAGRFSIGPQSFQVGISATKIGDRRSSLYNDFYSSAFTGTAPQENLVIGTSFRMSLFNKRLNFDASAATSLTNQNTTGGTVDAQVLADGGVIGQGDVSNVQDGIDIANKFITINTNLSPLPTKSDFFLDKNLYAFNIGGSVNAYNNNFSARWRQNGGYFDAFGASVQRDISSFELADRIRLLDNRLFFNVNYATLENNLSNTNANTLKTNLLGFNVSVFWPKMPSLTVGYSTQKRDNGFDYTKTDSTDEQVVKLSRPDDNTTNSLSFSTSYGLTMMDLRHNLSLTVSTSKTSDNTKDVPIVNYKAAGEASSNSLSLGVSTQWKIPLRTNLSISNSSGETQALATSGADSGNVVKSTSGAFGIGASGDYQMDLNADMTLNSQAGFSFASVDFGADKATITSMNLGQRFAFYQHHTLSWSWNLTSGIKIPVFDTAGNQSGTKIKSNTVLTVRYEYYF